MRSLLDVNVLIALLDSDHPFNGKMHRWWTDESPNGWASCPITENGVIRIMSNPNYRAVHPLNPNQIVEKLDAFAATTDHEFWPDDLSLRDEKIFERSLLTNSQQITDKYLLALAIKRGGRLVTLDAGIKVAAVRQAGAANLVIIR